MPLPLNKRLKARAPEAEEEYDEIASDSSGPSLLITGDDEDNQILSSDAEASSDEEKDAQEKITNISFATLSKAQDALSKKRKRAEKDTSDGDDKLAALRERLRQLREAKGLTTDTKKPSKTSRDDDSENSDSDSSGSDDDQEDDDDQGAPKSRSSKHAPGSQTSKRQVTRKRTVVDAPKRQSRDPRFGPLSGRPDDTLLQKNYAFLNTYAETEMDTLKSRIKASKSEDEKAELKRALLSMESKKKAREAKERQQEVVRAHRKKEKEAIQEGKNPFYLKRADQKQLALVDKFNSMKGKEREKLMQRRQKKVAGKEKKMMPQARRMG